MNLSENFKNRMKSLAGIITENITSESEDFPTPTEINEQQAEELFYKGIYIYIQYRMGTPSSTDNLLMFNKNIKDGSANIYLGGQTPGEYGFQNILKWFREREQFPLKFYTLNSNEPLIIEPN